MQDKRICIVGLGYVGLPLAYAFSKKYQVAGFDIDTKRIEELKKGEDKTLELSKKEMEEMLQRGVVFSAALEDIASYNVYIITVPTPIDAAQEPDLTPLIKASQSVSKVLKKGDIVIYESTVYPGVTEDVCVPILKEGSGLVFNEDFFCGYSPERINPGDKNRSVVDIIKITSGSTPQIAKEVDALYKSIIEAGTHLAPSIKVAEAAKVIENTQRDVNIALMNELAMMFNTMGIDTKSVLEAAGTKWNFIKLTPGLVGGHCIGVDPYYLTHKAKSLGYVPNLILSARYINDKMGVYVANRIIKLLIKKRLRVDGTKVLVLGITFKENCPDIRNSKVVDVVRELEDFGCRVDIFDPWADKAEVKREYGLEIFTKESEVDFARYEAIVLAVAHDAFKELDFDSKQIVYDIKSVLPQEKVDARL